MRGALLLALVALPLAARGDATTPRSAVVLRAGDGHLVGKDCLYPPTFTPTAAQLRRLDQALPAALAASRDAAARRVLARLGSDQRFYSGAAKGTIHVEGSCEPYNGVSCPPQVKDGGDCYWRITFDPKSGAFGKLDTNGRG